MHIEEIWDCFFFPIQVWVVVARSVGGLGGELEGSWFKPSADATWKVLW